MFGGEELPEDVLHLVGRGCEVDHHADVGHGSPHGFPIGDVADDGVLQTGCAHTIEAPDSQSAAL